jgi:hypothetical protein
MLNSVNNIQSQDNMDKLLALCNTYLKTCITGNGWEKSNVHFEICKFLCEHITQESYLDKHGSLKIRIHKLTETITDRIEDIGFPIPKGYTPATVLDEDMPRYSAKLAYRLVQLIDSQDKEELLKLVWKDEDFKSLRTPGR